MNSQIRKTSNLLVAGSIAVAGVLLFILYQFSHKNAKNNFLKNGGFERHQLAIELSLFADYDLSKDYYKIVDYNQNIVSLWQMEENKLLLFDAKVLRKAVGLNTVANSAEIFSITPSQENSIFDIQCNNNRKIIKYDIEKKVITSQFIFGDYFDKAINLSSKRFCTLTDAGLKSNFLKFNIYDFSDGKEKLEVGSSIKIKSMTEDGIFLKANNRYVYVNFYNHFFNIIDSSLYHREQFQTIDTVKSVPKIVAMKNNTIFKFKKQPRVVNAIASIDNNLLFVNSLIKSDTDEESVLKNTIILDVYDINKQGKYLGTVYVDKYKGNQLYDFKVRNNKLIFVYPNKMLIYDFAI